MYRLKTFGFITQDPLKFLISAKCCCFHLFTQISHDDITDSPGHEARCCCVCCCNVLDCGRLSMIPVSANLVIPFCPPSQVHLSSSDTCIISLLILDFPRGWSSAWGLTEQWKYSLVFGARTDAACSKDIYLDPALCQSPCSSSGHSEVLHFALELPVLGLVVLPHVPVES